MAKRKYTSIFDVAWATYGLSKEIEVTNDRTISEEFCRRIGQFISDSLKLKQSEWCRIKITIEPLARTKRIKFDEENESVRKRLYAYADPARFVAEEL